MLACFRFVEIKYTYTGEFMVIIIISWPGGGECLPTHPDIYSTVQYYTWDQGLCRLVHYQ